MSVKVNSGEAGRALIWNALSDAEGKNKIKKNLPDYKNLENVEKQVALKKFAKLIAEINVQKEGEVEVQKGKVAKLINKAKNAWAPTSGTYENNVLDYFKSKDDKYKKDNKSRMATFFEKIGKDDFVFLSAEEKAKKPRLNKGQTVPQALAQPENKEEIENKEKQEADKTKADAQPENKEETQKKEDENNAVGGKVEDKKNPAKTSRENIAVMSILSTIKGKLALQEHGPEKEQPANQQPIDEQKVEDKPKEEVIAPNQDQKNELENNKPDTEKKEDPKENAAQQDQNLQKPQEPQKEAEKLQNQEPPKPAINGGDKPQAPKNEVPNGNNAGKKIEEPKKKEPEIVQKKPESAPVEKPKVEQQQKKNEKVDPNQKPNEENKKSFASKVFGPLINFFKRFFNWLFNKEKEKVKV